MKKAFIYTRVSTMEQAKNGYSIGEQTRSLKAYCSAKGWKVCGIFTDAGKSGGNLKRDALQDMISRITETDIVLVYKLDRLSRSQKDTLTLIEDVFIANGVDFVSMTENFDTSTPFGRAMIGLLSVFAQLEKDKIKERMGIGRDAHIRDGFMWGNLPIGYERNGKEIVVNEYLAMQVKEMFRLVASGVRLSDVVRDFNERGFDLLGQIDTSHVRRIIRNKAYLGFVNYNGETFDGRHPALIDQETFDKANARLDENAEKQCGGRKNSYLSGLLYCSRCGSRYGSRTTGNPRKKLRNYCCYSRFLLGNASAKSESKCMNKIWRQNDLESLVFDEIRKLSVRSSTKKTDDSERIAVLNRELSSIDRQISRFLDLYGSSAISEKMLDEKVTALNEKKAKIRQEIETSKPSRSLPDAIDLSKTLDAVLKRNDFDEICDLLHSLIDRIELDGDDVRIHWSFC